MDVARKLNVWQTLHKTSTSSYFSTWLALESSSQVMQRRESTIWLQTTAERTDTCHCLVCALLALRTACSAQDGSRQYTLQSSLALGQDEGRVYTSAALVRTKCWLGLNLQSLFWISPQVPSPLNRSWDAGGSKMFTYQPKWGYFQPATAVWCILTLFCRMWVLLSCCKRCCCSRGGCSLNGSFHFDLLPETCLSCGNSTQFNCQNSNGKWLWFWAVEKKSIWDAWFTKSELQELREMQPILIAWGWYLQQARASNVKKTAFLKVATWWNDDWWELYEGGDKKACIAQCRLHFIGREVLWEVPTSCVIQPYP